MLEDIKTLLGISGTSQDAVLNIYIRRATTMILVYLNNSEFDDTYIQENFQDAIISLVCTAYKSKDEEGVKSKTQGQRSVTFLDNFKADINSIKSLLPMPYAKLM